MFWEKMKVETIPNVHDMKRHLHSLTVLIALASLCRHEEIEAFVPPHIRIILAVGTK